MKKSDFGEIQPIKTLMNEFKSEHIHLSDDNAFLFWFMKAYVTDNENDALAALTGNGDKGIDAIHIEDRSKNVFLVQGKFHSKGKLVTENRNDVISFANTANVFSDDGHFQDFLKKTNAKVRAKLPDVYKKVVNEKYTLNLHYVTTARISKQLKEDAYNIPRSVKNIKTNFIPFDNGKLVQLCNNYLEGAAPPVPTLDLPLSAEECFHRYDSRTGIDSWVFTMRGNHLGALFEKAGIRLFSRNIRGFLGDTKINEHMKKTIKREPEYFWYFNNGATIVCDKAEKRDRANECFLRVFNPQVINGQQTTRMLAEAQKSGSEVLARVMVLPQDPEEGRKRFSYVIDQIVKATNWQNKINQADLKSNDRIQVKLEMDLKKYKYRYIRKRQSVSELYRASPGEFILSIKKEELAKVIGACKLNPAIVRLGTDTLFDDVYYNQIFPNKGPIYQYLTFFWLHKVLSKVQLSDQLKKTIKYYGKWHVLNQVWRELEDILSTEARRKKFVYAMERKGINYDFYRNVYRPLENIIQKVFLSTRDFYREWRKNNAPGINENDFFKKKEIFGDHTSYLNSNRNKRRHSMDNEIDKFKKGIEAVEIL